MFASPSAFISLLQWTVRWNEKSESLGRPFLFVDLLCQLMKLC